MAHGRRQYAQRDAQERTVSLDFQAAPRAAQALRLRRIGYTYDEIARRCGYANESGARKAIKKARAGIIRDEAQALVGWQCDMLDAALQVVMRRIVADNEDSLAAVDRLTPLLKRQADLLALDAPKATDAVAAGVVLIRRYGVDTEAI